MSKVCSNPNCGFVEEMPGAKYCGMCGGELREAAVPPPIEVISHRNGSRVIPIAVIAVFLTIVLIIIIASVNSSSRHKPDTSYSPPTESPSPPPAPAYSPPAPPPEPEVRYGRITGNRVNVRSGPGVNYGIVTELNTNDRIKVIKEAPADNQSEGRLYNSETVELTGGGSKRLNQGHAVTIIDTYDSRYKVSFEVKNDSRTYYGYVNRSNVKLFSSDYWYEVEVNGISGWVIDDYVSVD